MALIERLLPGWSADQALRYLPVASELVRATCRDDLVAEIGSGSHGISAYWPGNFLGVDVGFDGPPARTMLPVMGSVTQLPFATGALPVVFSVDMLEHVPPPVREAALREMVRVTGDVLIVAYPSDSPEKERLETKWARVHERDYGQPNRWLAEHRSHGLPKSEEVRRIVEDAAGPGARIRVRESLNLTVWYWINTAFHSSNPLVKKLAGSHTLQVLAIPLLRRMNWGPCYREILVLEKPAARG